MICSFLPKEFHPVPADISLADISIGAISSLHPTNYSIVWVGWAYRILIRRPKTCIHFKALYRTRASRRGVRRLDRRQLNSQPANANSRGREISRIFRRLAREPNTHQQTDVQVRLSRCSLTIDHHGWLFKISEPHKVVCLPVGKLLPPKSQTKAFLDPLLLTSTVTLEQNRPPLRGEKLECGERERGLKDDLQTKLINTHQQAFSTYYFSLFLAWKVKWRDAWSHGFPNLTHLVAAAGEMDRSNLFWSRVKLSLHI